MPGWRGVADRVGPGRAQRVRRHAGDAPARELEFRLRWRHVRGWPPVQRRRRVPHGDHQLSCDRSRGPRIGTGGVCQPQGRDARRARAGRLRQAQRTPLPGGRRRRRPRTFPCRPSSPAGHRRAIRPRAGTRTARLRRCLPARPLYGQVDQRDRRRRVALGDRRRIRNVPESGRWTRCMPEQPPPTAPATAGTWPHRHRSCRHLGEHLLGRSCVPWRELRACSRMASSTS